MRIVIYIEPSPPEGVLDQLQGGLAEIGFHGDGGDVEAHEAAAQLGMGDEEGVGQADQPAAFANVDGLAGTAGRAAAAAGLDLDDGQQLAPADDEVDLTAQAQTVGPPVAVQDLPAAAGVLGADQFLGPAAQVFGAPLGHRPPRAWLRAAARVASRVAATSTRQPSSVARHSRTSRG